MNRSLPFSPSVAIAAVILALTLPGCSKKETPEERAAARAERAAAREAARQAKPNPQKKFNLYVDCYNNADGNFHKSLERYASWIKDMDVGPTGKEPLIDLYDVHQAQRCKKAVEEANAMEPKMPDVEAAASAYVASLEPLEATINEAAPYYDRKNYKDDGLAKGKALHKPLVEQGRAFAAASKKLAGALDEVNDQQQQAQLQELEKEGGRDLSYYHLSVMIQAKDLMKALTQDDADVEKAAAKLDAFEKTVDEMSTTADKVEKKPAMWSHYSGRVENFRKAAKELYRRMRDKTPYSASEKTKLGTSSGWMVEGSPDKLVRNYNDMVGASNNLR